MSEYDPLSIPEFSYQLTLTPLPSPESEVSAIVPILELTEQIGGGGSVFADPVAGYDIGYGIQLNTTNMPWVLQAMGVSSSLLTAADNASSRQ